MLVSYRKAGAPKSLSPAVLVEGLLHVEGLLQKDDPRALSYLLSCNHLLDFNIYIILNWYICDIYNDMEYYFIISYYSNVCLVLNGIVYTQLHCNSICYPRLGVFKRPCECHPAAA